MKLNLLLLSAAAMVSAATATQEVDLGTAGDYVILSKTGISTVPASVIDGDIAVSPIAAGAITGFELVLESGTGGKFSTDSSTQVQGDHKVYAANYHDPTPTTLTAAVSDMETAYTNAAGRVNTDAERINLNDGLIGGETLTPGVYTFGSDVTITTDVTISGTSTDVFIIQTTGNVVLEADVILSGGVLAENIFWQVAGHVTVNAGMHMEGVLLIKTAATFNTLSSLNGRILAQTAVNMQKVTITEPV